MSPLLNPQDQHLFILALSSPLILPSEKSLKYIALEEAVKDVNANASVLPNTKLVLTEQNSNCSGFLAWFKVKKIFFFSIHFLFLHVMVFHMFSVRFVLKIAALLFMETDVVAIIGSQSSVVAHIISHVANELQVPLLSFAATDPTLTNLHFPFFVRTTMSEQRCGLITAPTPSWSPPVMGRWWW